MRAPGSRITEASVRVVRAGIAGAGHARSKLLEHRNRLVVGGDHPVLTDDALEPDQFALVALVGGVGGDVDVATVVFEDCAIFRVGEAVTGGAEGGRPKPSLTS